MRSLLLLKSRAHPWPWCLSASFCLTRMAINTINTIPNPCKIEVLMFLVVSRYRNMGIDYRNCQKSHFETTNSSKRRVALASTPELHAHCDPNSCKARVQWFIAFLPSLRSEIARNSAWKCGWQHPVLQEFSGYAFMYIYPERTIIAWVQRQVLNLLLHPYQWLSKYFAHKSMKQCFAAHLTHLITWKKESCK